MGCTMVGLRRAEADMIQSLIQRGWPINPIGLSLDPAWTTPAISGPSSSSSASQPIVMDTLGPLNVDQSWLTNPELPAIQDDGDEML